MVYYTHQQCASIKHIKTIMQKIYNESSPKKAANLSINSDCQTVKLENTEWLFNRIVNVPSSVVLND